MRRRFATTRRLARAVALAIVAAFVSTGFFSARGAGESSPTPAKSAAEGQALAQKVFAIFKAKCAECHDEATARPRGDFGYVLDLPRVAANSDWVTPGKPDESELYQLVEDDEMPGDEASAPPLTPEEKEIVRRWIALGAPADFSFSQNEKNDAATAAASAAQSSGSNEDTKPGANLRDENKLSDAAISSADPLSKKNPPIREQRARTLSFGWRLIRAFGQFHPPSSHFPIALLIAAIPAEVMWKLTRKPSWKATVRFCVTLGAASAALTAALGWCDAAFSNYTSATTAPVLAWHRWVGTATAVWAALTAVLSEFAHRENHPRRLRYAFRACLLAGVILVSISGFLGASLIYGLRHFRW